MKLYLDSTDRPLIDAAQKSAFDHKFDSLPLLALADKKQEEGHEDFAHLLRAGVNHGAVGIGWHRQHGLRGEYVPIAHYDDTQGSPHGVIEFLKPEGSLLHIAIPIHHPDYRSMMMDLTKQPVPASFHHRAFWLGHNPVPIETLDQLNRLRAFHNRPPLPPGTLGVYHAIESKPPAVRGHVLTVTSRPGSRFFIDHHDHMGIASGDEGPFRTAEEAHQEAKRQAGLHDSEEIARQYQRATLSIQTRFGR